MLHSLLDDPAFSPDPRSHPDARLYTPSPPLVPQVQTINSALKPISTNIPRTARMKAFVRRLTARHSLDRIDELDETDPFGGSYHHRGPYEAIGGSLVQPTIPLNAPPRRAHSLSSKRESDHLPLRPAHHQPPYRAPPSAYGESGLSLRLEPGQILQPNTIYGSHLATITASPSQFRPQPNNVSVTTRPNPSRRQSLPNPRTYHRQEPSPSDPRYGSLDRRSSSLHAAPQRYRGDYAPDIPSDPLPHHDRDAAPYVHQKTVFPPPRYESRLHALGPARLMPRHTPPPSLDSTLPQTRSTENAAAISRHDPGLKTVDSLDSSHTTNDTFTLSSSIPNKPIESSRIRHLPKRLVMPAPLQPQLPQSHYDLPPAESPSWPDEYPDDHVLEGAHFQGKPAMYSQEPKLLRKRSSAFPAKSPLPDHAPMSHDDDASIIGNPSTKVVDDAEGTKERTRRRRLSKRKNDIELRPPFVP